MFYKLREIALAFLGFTAAAIFIPIALATLVFVLIYAVIAGVIPAVIVAVLLDLIDVDPTVIKAIAIIVWVLSSIVAFISAASGSGGGLDSNEATRVAVVDSEENEMNYEHHQKWRTHHQNSSSMPD